MIHIEEITPDNWRIGLHVKEDQKKYVANATVLMARAYAYRSCRSKAFYIYNDDTPVGMGLYYDCDELNLYDLSQFFIDERYQGKGYGYAAMQFIIAELKKDGKYNKVTLCLVDGDDAALSLYKKCGFTLTGDEDGEEIIMELNL